MIAKGIISAIHTEANKIDVILPEYDNIVIPNLRLYTNNSASGISVNDFVIVISFDDNLANGIVLLKNSIGEVDSELSELSKNPVQNAIITKAINEIDKELSRLDNKIVAITKADYDAGTWTAPEGAIVVVLEAVQ